MNSEFSISILQSPPPPTNAIWSEQLEERFLLKHNGTKEVIRLHDYRRLYAVPGLYNHILNDLLKCSSHEVVAEALQHLMEASTLNLKEAKILDFAAGNGLVAKALYDKGARFFVGVDIEREAKKAAEREFPMLYQSYKILDFCKLSTLEKNSFEQQKLNTLVVASALGFGEKHVPVKAFIHAFNLIENGGAIVFCIYDQYLSEVDKTGYKKVLEKIQEESFDLRENKRYVHRNTVFGGKMWFRVIAGFKKSAIRFQA